MPGEPQEITTLVGREVYSNSGVFVGEVEDVELDVDGEMVTGLALTDLNRELLDGVVGDARGVMLPYRWVMAVGDVVLVNDLVERVGEPAEQEESADEVAAA